MTIEKIYWDSACFLAHLKAETDRAEKCDGVLQRAERGEVLIVTSALTLAEVLWMKGAPKIPKDKAEIIQKFFRKSYIRVYNVTRKLAEEAQIHVWENGIKPKDAIHIATAIHLKVDAFETFDQPLISRVGKIGSHALNIRSPEASAQRRMDLRAPE
jgi:hypothetical protein